MRDHFTGDNVEVQLDSKCGPYIMIEPARIATVEELLRSNDILFKVEEGPHACKGTPEAAVIEFLRQADLPRIQSLLDSVQ